MESLAILVLALLCALFLWRLRPASPKEQDQVSSFISIEQIRSIGELSVFQVYSKEIVTKTSHTFGEFGKEYLRWLISEKKLSMIFEFEINFVYDLRSQALEISEPFEGKYVVKMPPCRYKFSIANIKFYDEKNGKFIPFLLPDFVNGFLGAGFSEEDKNRLIADARSEVEKMCARLIAELKAKIHKSARDTLEAIAKSFGAREVVFEFCDDESELSKELASKAVA